MIIYPALDLIGGCCVRLTQGRFEQTTLYSAKPAAALARFAASGATWAHVVDLDGARAGSPAQHDLLVELARTSEQKLQVAGGFRTKEQVRRMIDGGAARVVIGSIVVEQPRAAQELLEEFGADRIVLALDVRVLSNEILVACQGWARTSEKRIFDVLGEFPRARHVLITDIARDGMRVGPNVELIGTVSRACPHVQVQASGGIARLEDLDELAGEGAAGAIVGKALWEGDLDLGEAIEIARA